MTFSETCMTPQPPPAPRGMQARCVPSQFVPPAVLGHSRHFFLYRWICLSVPLFSILCLCVAHGSTSPATFSHQLLDQVVSAFVDSAGNVDYPALKRGRQALDQYLDSLAVVGPRSQPERFPTPQHELAYWLNAYNAFVLKGVIDAYPVASVMDIEEGEFFKVRRFLSGGDSLSLDQLENDIVRPLYRDSRVHFALNCGAKGCPALARAAFSGAHLDSHLDAARERFMRELRQVRVDREQSVIYLSKILDWFGTDFTTWSPAATASPDGREMSIIDYLILHLPDDAAGYLRTHPGVEIVFVDYDWSLNAASPAEAP